MILYSKPNCEKCDDIKTKLKEKNVAFVEKSIKEPGVMDEVKVMLQNMPSAILPILKFDDEKVVSNDMGLYKELRARGII